MARRIASDACLVPQTHYPVSPSSRRLVDAERILSVKPLGCSVIKEIQRTIHTGAAIALMAPLYTFNDSNE